MSWWEICPFLITYLETKNQFQRTAHNTKCTCKYCMPLSKWNKLCKRFQLNPTNPVAQRRQKKYLRFVEMDQMEGSRLGGTWERTNNFCCQGLVWQPSLCIFPCSNSSCLCLSVDRWQVMMVFSSLFLIVYFFLILLFVELTFPCCFSRSKSPKGWSTGSNIFWLFFFLWFLYCVSFPWVSEIEMIYLFILFLLALPWRIQKRKKKHWRQHKFK